MAIRIQLQTGKTVMVNNILDALNFDYQEAIASNSGYYDVGDPFSEESSDDYEEVIIGIELPDIEYIEEVILEENFEDDPE